MGRSPAPVKQALNTPDQSLYPVFSYEKGQLRARLKTLVAPKPGNLLRLGWALHDGSLKEYFTVKETEGTGGRNAVGRFGGLILGLGHD